MRSAPPSCPPLEQAFLPTSYANRKGFGSHRALRRFVRECRRHKWVLQADLRLYFPRWISPILRAQLAERIACSGTPVAAGSHPLQWRQLRPGDRWLSRRHPAHPPGAAPRAADRQPHQPVPRQSPPRSLRSPHRRPARHRGLPAHVDDFALFADSPQPLRQAREVIESELAALRLRLHPIKSQIRRTRPRHQLRGLSRAARTGACAQPRTWLKGRRRLKVPRPGGGEPGPAPAHPPGRVMSTIRPPGPRPHRSSRPRRRPPRWPGQGAAGSYWSAGENHCWRRIVGNKQSSRILGRGPTATPTTPTMSTTTTVSASVASPSTLPGPNRSMAIGREHRGVQTRSGDRPHR